MPTIVQAVPPARHGARSQAIRHALGRLVPVLAAIALAGCATDPERVERRHARGVVASPEAHATEAGIAILEAGGNAVDAAIAVHFALAVTLPNAGNVGGGGFLLLHDPSAEGGEDVVALDYRETAPAAATREMYLDVDGNVIPGESLYTHRAAGVPGSVAGMWALHGRYGSLPWEDLLAPAIALADEGFEIGEYLGRSIEKAEGVFAALDEARREHVDFSRHISGRAGDALVQRVLAGTLRRIATDGRADFYSGETARLVVEEMERGGGLITVDDLATYGPAWREPVESTYRGRRVVSMPPPSSGGVALLQILGMLERFEMPERLSATHMHLLAEAEKRAFADRSEHLGDPDHVDVPVRALLAPDYLAARAAAIRLDARTDPADIAPADLRAVPAESTETTHFAVVDRDGMAVSCTTTLNAAFGSGIVVDGAGFLLNNEMDDFSAKPGVPNLYGVTGGDANAIAPGRRMLSSMTPTLVFDESGALELILGSPGGPTIITSVLQVLSNVVDYGLPLEDAVESPRAHHQWPPRVAGRDPIVVEKDDPYRVPERAVRGLEALGYSITYVPNLGDVQAVRIGEGGPLGIADSRRGGTARATRSP